MAKRDLKSDRISFVLDKELTPILKIIAEESGTNQSKLINSVVVDIIIENIDLLTDEEQIKTVTKLKNARDRRIQRINAIRENKERRG